MTDEPDADQDEDEEAPFDPGAGAIDIPKLSQAIIHMLQTDRLKYKRFGIYWWPIKAMLKRAGYTRAQLSMLGDFEDPETAAMVPKLTLEHTIRAAVRELAFNNAHPHSDGRVENENGELVEIKDDDAGF